MTRNNLNEHLSWLLNFGSATASNVVIWQGIGISKSPPENKAVSLDIGYTDCRALALGQSPNSDSGIEIVSNDFETKKQLHITGPALPEKALKRSEDMAVLKSAGVNKRPCLISNLPDGGGNNTTKTSRHEGPLLSEQYSTTVIEKKDGSKEKDVSTGNILEEEGVQRTETSDCEHHASSSSTIDTFGEPRQLWRADSAARVEPIPKRGKKRKSEEIGSDKENLHRTPRPIQGSQDSFLSIDDFDLSPPRTLKTPAQRRKAVLEQSKSQQSKAPVAPNIGKGASPLLLQDRQDRLRGEQSPQKDRHYQVPTESHAAPTASQTPKARDQAPVTKHQISRSQKRQVIFDTEDEDELEDNVQTCQASSGFKSRTPKKEPVLAIDKIEPPSSSPSKIRDLASLKRGASGQSPNSRAKRVLLNDANVSASPFQKDSPTKAPTNENGCTSTSSGQSTDHEQMPRVEKFLRTDPESTKSRLVDLHNERASLAKKASDLVMVGGAAEDWQHIQSRTVSLANEIIPLERLIAQREVYDRVSKEQKHLRVQISRAWEADQNSEELMDKEQLLSRKMKEMKVAMSALLNKAGRSNANQSSWTKDNSEMDQKRESDELDNVMVKSTQAVNPLGKAHNTMKTSSNSSHTHLIEQTPRNETKTPHIKGAAEDVNKLASVTWQREALNSEQAVLYPALERPDNREARPEALYDDFERDDIAPLAFDSRSTQRRYLGVLHEDEYQLGENQLPQLRDDDYLASDDDDMAMLEVADQLESHRTKAPSLVSPTKRTAFSETTGNVPRPGNLQGISPRKHHSSPPKTFPWSADVQRVLRSRFHLQGFRPNQLQAINATLAGKDAFVLMPTGGGKSLCYQLPSVVESGKTRGVTVVISPLLSLMDDQVDHLRKLQIQAHLINGDLSDELRDALYQSLRESEPERFIQLLYITPEMINKSQAMTRALSGLHKRRKLARIVIDEAHCVSQWGHDFRPDYKSLGEVRALFPGVPVMALTATATENVKVDVIHNLGMDGCEVFSQSFNRPNLRYEVHRKVKTAEAFMQIANIIKQQHAKQSGIIYCLSRKNCESVAEKLRKEKGIKAHHYHAGMSSEDRQKIQRQWQAGVYHVIVATIAFGMGIDKPDVRFVIHYTIPKSLEGYYQETGRAGRDGNPSGCYLFYGYQDTASHKRMIDEGEGSFEQKERQRQMLKNVVQFCENKSDCRRVQVLQYFNEPFHSRDCNDTCDNCLMKGTCTVEVKDFTEHAIAAIRMVQEISTQSSNGRIPDDRTTIERSRLTILQYVDIFCGLKNRRLEKLGHNDENYFGIGKNFTRGDGMRIFFRLISEDAIRETHIVNKATGFAQSYVQLGPKHQSFLRGQQKLHFQVLLSPANKLKTKKGKAPAKSDSKSTRSLRAEYPLSTNVSSPIQDRSRRRNPRKFEDDGDLEEQSGDEYVDDGFVVNDQDVDLQSDRSDDEELGPIQIAGLEYKTRRRELGPPITSDQMLDSLGEIHRMIVDEFVREAENEMRKITVSSGNRNSPFSITSLRAMAIDFPKDEKELMSIPGINVESAKRYGTRFLKLIRKAEKHYQDSMHEPGEVPHHLDNSVVVISDDEDDMNEFESDAFDDEDKFPGQRSTYFEPDPEVRAFNERCKKNNPQTLIHLTLIVSRLQKEHPRSQKQKASQQSGSRGRGSRSGMKSGRGRSSRNPRGSYKKTRAASNSSRGRRSASAHGTAFGLMPT